MGRQLPQGGVRVSAGLGGQSPCPSAGLLWLLIIRPVEASSAQVLDRGPLALAMLTLSPEAGCLGAQSPCSFGGLPSQHRFSHPPSPQSRLIPVSAGTVPGCHVFSARGPRSG